MATVVRNIAVLMSPLQQIALEFGRFIAIQSHGMLGIAAQSCKNLGEASELFCSYIKVRAQGSQASINRESKGIRLIITDDSRYNAPEDPDLQCFFELVLVSNFKYFCDIAIAEKPQNPPITFRLTQSQEQGYSIESYLEVGIVEFDQSQFEFIIPDSWLNIPLIQDNSELRGLAESQCKIELLKLSPKDLVQEIRDRLQATNGIKPSINTMAKQLFMSTSSLQRKLKLQHITYQELKQQERLNEAKRLLTLGKISVEEIALALGFSDASNFSKSFKKWTGLTPYHFRNTENPE